jgi:hypothetical protein
MTAQRNRMILERDGGSATGHHFLIPDGVLFKDGAAIASFEAKYREYSPANGPREKDIYQALAAARAVSAPLSVLVYPGKFEPGSWQVAEAGEHPATLAVLGLDMFDYARTGADLRARQILSLLKRSLPSEQKEIMVTS